MKRFLKTVLSSAALLSVLSSLNAQLVVTDSTLPTGDLFPGDSYSVTATLENTGADIAADSGTTPVLTITGPDTYPDSPISLDPAINAAIANGDTVDISYDLEVPYVLAGGYSVNLNVDGSDYDLGDITIRASQIPEIELISPQTGDTSNSLSDVIIAVNASDPDGSLAQIEFYANGTLLDTWIPSTPTAEIMTSVSFTPAAEGGYEIYAVATDDSGNEVTSTSALITATTGSGSAPVVSISAPSSATLGMLQFVTATASDDVAVSRVEFFVNGVYAATDSTAQGGDYNYYWTPAASGRYELIAVAYDASGNRSASDPSVVTVTVGTDPVVTIMNPLDGVTYLAGESFTIQADASDLDGAIDNIAFYDNGSLLTVLSSSPYEFEYTASNTGSHSLIVIATDNNGNTSADSTSFTVATSLARPFISMTNPTDGSSFTSVSTIALSAEVSYNSQDIVSVEFFVDGLSAGTDTYYNGGVFTGDTVQDTYTVTYQPHKTGTLEVVAVAEDSSGNKTASETVSIDVSAAASLPPTVELFSPLDGGVYLPNTELSFFAKTGDSDGLVSAVGFYVNGVLVSSVSSAPFETSYTVSGVGDYEVIAVAVDNSGNQTASTPVTFNVGASGSLTPNVTITHPLPLGGGDTINDMSISSDMYMNATIDGLESIVSGGVTYEPQIDSVVFYINGAEVGEATAHIDNVYGLYYMPSAIGSYTIHALAEVSYVSDTAAVYTDSRHLDGVFDGLSTGMILDVVDLERNLPTNELTLFPDSIEVGDNINDNLTLISKVDGGLNEVDRVDFYADGILIGSSVDFVEGANTEVYFSFSWIPPETAPDSGSYSITSRAVQIDAGDGTADNWVISDPVTVTVTETVGVGYDVVLTELFSDSQVIQPQSTVPLQVNIYEAGTTGTSTEATIEKVVFYQDGNLLEEDTQYPYQMDFIPSSTGTYTLYARAYDADGFGVWSNALSLPVQASGSPVLEITSPTVGQTMTVDSDVVLSASAYDEDGSISQVIFTLNGYELSTLTEAPYSFTWTPSTAGDFVLEVTAIDNLGLQTSESRAVTVTDRVGRAPSISLSLTGNGNVTPGSRILANANVLDDDETDMQVAFFLNGEQLDSDTETDGIQADSEPPFSIIIDPVLESASVYPRSYEVRAVATDRDGNSRSAYFDQIYISDFSVSFPGIELVSPDEGTDVTAGSRISLRADLSGSGLDDVKEVIFYANGIEVGSVTEAPYSYDWIPDDNDIGEVEITASVLRNGQEFEYYSSSTDSFYVTVYPVQTVDPVIVNVNEVVGTLPAISLAVVPSDDEGNATAQGSKLRLFANVVDDAEDSLSVSFYKDGELIDADPDVDGVQTTDDAYPYTTTLVVNEEGEFLLNARVTDADGNTVNSGFASLLVDDSVAPVPTINLTIPASGQSGSTVPLRATFDGFINDPSSVSFYANGEKIGEVTESPFNFEWSPTWDGDVYIFAAAEVSLTAGGILRGVSDVASLTLQADAVPVIESFSSSVSSGTIYSGDTVSFNVEASDNGYISKVELFRNGEVVQSNTDGTNSVRLTDTPPGLGSYTYTVAVIDNNGNTTLSNGSVEPTSGSASYAIQVVADESPTATISADATEFFLNDDIYISLDASDPDGYIMTRQYYVNNVEITEAGTLSDTLEYTLSQVGTYVFKAIVTDNRNNQTESNELIVTATKGVAPLISISNPVDGSVYKKGSTVTLKADVDIQNSGGSVQSVTFLQNGVVIGEADTVSPWETELTLSSVTSSLSLKARVVDNHGNTVTSDPVSIQVIADQSPVISAFTADASYEGGTNYSTLTNTAVTLSLSASDSDGYIVSRRFYWKDQNQLLNADSTTAVSITVQPTAQGVYTYYAEVEDNAGNITTTSDIVLNVSGGNLPYVEFLSPENNDYFEIGETINVELDAVPGNVGGEITEVVFFANGIPVGETLTEGPWEIELTPDVFIPDGENSVDVVLTARVKDSHGNTVDPSDSDSVSIYLVRNLPKITTTAEADSDYDDGLHYVALVNEPISLSVDVDNDEDLPESTLISLLLGGAEADQSLGLPADFSYTPTSPGYYTFTARMKNADGRLVETRDEVIVKVLIPEAMSNEEFIQQVYYNLTFETLDDASLTAFLDDLGDDISSENRANSVLEIMKEDTYTYMHRVLMANQVVLDEWPDLDAIETGVENYLSFGFDSYIDVLLDEFETSIWSGLEDKISATLPDMRNGYTPLNNDIDQLFAVLFEHKYNVDVSLADPLDPYMTVDNLATVRSLLKSEDLNNFVQAFVLDNGNSLEDDTPLLGLELAGDATLNLVPDGHKAALLIGVAQLEPGTDAFNEAFDSMENKLLYSQVVQAIDLLNASTDEVIDSVFEMPQVLPGGFKYLSWFGAFNESLYPYVYSYENGSWYWVHPASTTNNIFLWGFTEASYLWTNPMYGPSYWNYANSEWQQF